MADSTRNDARKYKSKDGKMEFDTEAEANAYDGENKGWSIRCDDDSNEKEEGKGKGGKSEDDKSSDYLDKEGFLKKDMPVKKFPINLPKTRTGILKVCFGDKPVMFIDYESGEFMLPPGLTEKEKEEALNKFKGSTSNGKELKFVGVMKDLEGLENGKITAKVLKNKINEAKGIKPVEKTTPTNDLPANSNTAKTGISPSRLLPTKKPDNSSTLTR
jgi:hypothetical protein